MHEVAKEHFRYLLQEQRTTLTARVDRINVELLSEMRDNVYDTAMYDNHPGDIATEMFEREKDLGLRSGFWAQIDEVDEALHALDEGTYGICTECGHPIPAERLEVMPQAIMCAECRQALENRPDTNERPVEEDVLRPAFHRWRVHGEDEYNGFDPEDSWQDVAVYGTSETPSDLPGARDYGDLYRSNERIGAVEEVELLIDDKGDALSPEDRG